MPRDRASSFEPRLVPKGSRRSGGLDEMIISLYAGGMTARDIQHHLARTLGTELSHDTISKITFYDLEPFRGRPGQDRRADVLARAQFRSRGYQLGMSSHQEGRRWSAMT